MGLDCTAYKNIRQMNENEITYDEYEDENGKVVDRYPNNGVSFYINPGFTEVAKEILPDAIYDFEDSFRWKAGSYSGYNSWRNWLATVAGWKSDEDAWSNGKNGQPFFELIHFSDCEGTLGTQTCQKLLQDFINFESKAKTMSQGSYYFDMYTNWKKAMTIASENGAISFH